MARRSGGLGKAMARGFLRTAVWVYRRRGGKIAGRLFGAPLLLLTTTGRRSGKPWTVPLMYQTDSDRWVIMASNGGSDRHPAWWLNLRAHPEATIQDPSPNLSDHRRGDVGRGVRAAVPVDGGHVQGLRPVRQEDDPHDAGRCPTPAVTARRPRSGMGRGRVRWAKIPLPEPRTIGLGVGVVAQLVAPWMLPVPPVVGLVVGWR
jgi:deazaflavin-dependent oxidoreductase (nitroreductase family)